MSLTAGMPSARATMAIWLDGPPPPAPDRAAARGRNRAAPPGSSSARQGWRFPAARPAAGQSSGRQADAGGDWRCRQVVQPVAQIRVGLALQLGAGVVVDALDRGLGGQASSSPPRAAGAASRDRARSCGRLRARRGARLPTPSSLRSIRSSTDARMALDRRRRAGASSRFHIVGDDRWTRSRAAGA